MQFVLVKKDIVFFGLLSSGMLCGMQQLKDHLSVLESEIKSVQCTIQGMSDGYSTQNMSQQVVECLDKYLIEVKFQENMKPVRLKYGFSEEYAEALVEKKKRKVDECLSCIKKQHGGQMVNHFEYLCKLNELYCEKRWQLKKLMAESQSGTKKRASEDSDNNDDVKKMKHAFTESTIL